MSFVAYVCAGMFVFAYLVFFSAHGCVLFDVRRSVVVQLRDAGLFVLFCSSLLVLVR